jgi:lipooligosaccharide transport system permease protein
MGFTSAIVPRVSHLAWRVWQRNLTVFIRVWRVNFIPPFLEPVLYLLALGFGVGAFIPVMDGIPYPEFVAPAIVAVSVMNASFFECTYASFVRMYYQKTFEAIISTPVTVEEVVTGEILWGATRGLLYCSLMLPVLAIFSVVTLPGALLLVPLSFIAGFLFASIGMCFTSVTPDIETLNYPAFLFITPMFLFSGTFFPLDLLPVAIQYIAYAVLPLTHVVILARMCTLQAFSIDGLWHLAWVLAAGLVFYLVALKLMRRRLVV